MTESESQPGSVAGNSPPAQKRQRAKQACEPCRLRKRRCDGGTPCNMCTQFEYKCYYERHPRKRSKIVEAQQPTDVDSEHMSYMKQELTNLRHLAGEDVFKLRSMEANSGIAFTRLLGMRLDPGSGPKLFTFGWNLGVSSPIVTKSPPVTELLTYEQMQAMAQLFFTHVHPLYGFLDREWTLRQLTLRWSNPSSTNIPDHLLCGIAAMGSLFADGSLNLMVPRLVDAAKIALEGASTMVPPSLQDISSWLLRVLFLRSTDHPHACWMATCTTMHLVESIGLQQENSNLVVYPPHEDHAHDPDVRRRVFWVARMLNSWVSFEYGRTRVSLRGVTCKLPAAKPDDYTTDFIDLYGLSCVLEPDRNSPPGQWDDLLRQVESYEARHDAVQLSRANIALTTFRRLRIANPNIPLDTLNRIISILLNGLEAAKNLASKGMPWWHVANIPFQATCVFLAMDSRESIAHIATALKVLEYVVYRFKTPALKDALKTARFLIRLSKKRKEEDTELLSQSLLKEPSGFDITRMNGSPPRMIPEGPSTTSSGEDWNLEYLNHSEFDWNFFLSHEMPTFAPGYMPDGAM
ncbi:hypothetical protein K431DRAFT_271773 [Polychaeton citri CBS 116435]|uniref:Zn(2)-C6 fungal-type domain-containing protein n=1 Tax=Polychaeton citri CBS 116435 TaxID=1314669 RepID=A0A9P4UPF6_9PEZI|nr:hypothetical protein K431DRAFT_271773 [Polychaeton citri CBS 116435]